MKKRFLERLKSLAPFLFLLLLSLRFCYPALFQDKTFYAFDNLVLSLPWSTTGDHPPPHNPLISDPVNIYYPHYKFVSEFFDPGDFSFRLWNPSNFCGKPNPPFGGNPIEFIAYWVLSPSRAHDVVLFLHLLATGLFMFLYLREIGLRVLPALTGAVAWMFNGHLMVWFQFQNLILGAPTLPAALLCLERWLRTGRKSDALLLACALCFTIASGYAPLVFFHFLFLAVYALYRWRAATPEGRGRGRLGKMLVHGALGAALCLAVAATFLSSHHAFLEESHRKEFRFEELFQRTGQLPEVYLLTLLFPDFFGTPVGGGETCFTPGAKPYNNYNELCIYSGVFLVFLASACVPFLGRRRFVLFYFAAALIPLLMAMGSFLYYPLFRFLPGFNLSTPTRILYLFCFSLTVMVALGADIVVDAVNGRRRWIVVCAGLLLLLGLFFGAFVQTESGIRWVSMVSDLDYGAKGVPEALSQYLHWSRPAVLRPLLFSFLSFGVILAIVFTREALMKQKALLLGILVLTYDLISFGLQYNSLCPRELEYPKTGAVRFLQKDPGPFRIMSLGKFLHNGFAPFGIEDIGGYSSFYPRRYAEYLHLIQSGAGTPFPENFSRWVVFEQFQSPLLDLVNVKYVLIPPDWEIRWPSLDLVYNGEVRIYRNRNVLPRAFIVPSYRICRTREDAYAALGASTLEDFRGRVILESEPPAEFLSPGAKGPAESPEVTGIRYGRDRVEISVRCPTGGFLVLSDAFHGDWVAKVDGVESPVLRANYIMRGIPLRAGSERVEILFRPLILFLGPGVTALGWAALAVLLVLSLRREKKEREAKCVSS